MNTPRLHDDIARCLGYGPLDDLREGCIDCLRRTEPVSGEWTVMMAAPEIIGVECEMRIAP